MQSAPGSGTCNFVDTLEECTVKTASQHPLTVSIVTEPL